jgi:hypothetical protein
MSTVIAASEVVFELRTERFRYVLVLLESGLGAVTSEFRWNLEFRFAKRGESQVLRGL